VIDDVLVWNGRVANAAPAKEEEVVAARPAAKWTAGGGDAIEVGYSQRAAIVVQPDAFCPERREAQVD
jgi:hypothetical protein